MVKHFLHRSPRLLGYDYRQAGYYFVTACTKNRACLFGNIKDGLMAVNATGKIVEKCWNDLSNHYRCHLDFFVVMPNHIHGIIIIPEFHVDAGLKPASTETKYHGLTEIMRGFKTFSARRINELPDSLGEIIWQRSFYDHIIRDERGLENIRQYINNNPLQWEQDRNNLSSILM